MLSRSDTSFLWLFSIFVQSFLNDIKILYIFSIVSLGSVLSASFYYEWFDTRGIDSVVCRIITTFALLLSLLVTFFYYPKSSFREFYPKLYLFGSF